MIFDLWYKILKLLHKAFWVINNIHSKCRHSRAYNYILYCSTNSFQIFCMKTMNILSVYQNGFHKISNYYSVVKKRKEEICNDASVLIKIIIFRN